MTLESTEPDWISRCTVMVPALSVTDDALKLQLTSASAALAHTPKNKESIILRVSDCRAITLNWIFPPDTHLFSFISLTFSDTGR